jgi:hypothetical protein
MKTLQTKRATKLFGRWFARGGALDPYTRNLISSWVDGKEYYCGDYHALRDLIREFCEERGYRIIRSSLGTRDWYTQRVGGAYREYYLDVNGYSGYDLALLAALEKALEVK